MARVISDTYPEIVASGRPDFRAIAESVGHQAGAEVTGRIDCVSCLLPVASPESEYQEEGRERESVTAILTRVSCVRE